MSYDRSPQEDHVCWQTCPASSERGKMLSAPAGAIQHQQAPTVKVVQYGPGRRPSQESPCGSSSHGQCQWTIGGITSSCRRSVPDHVRGAGMSNSSAPYHLQLSLLEESTPNINFLRKHLLFTNFLEHFLQFRLKVFSEGGGSVLWVRPQDDTSGRHVPRTGSRCRRNSFHVHKKLIFGVLFSKL